MASAQATVSSSASRDGKRDGEVDTYYSPPSKEKLEELAAFLLNVKAASHNYSEDILNPKPVFDRWGRQQPPTVGNDFNGILRGIARNYKENDMVQLLTGNFQDKRVEAIVKISRDPEFVLKMAPHPKLFLLYTTNICTKFEKIFENVKKISSGVNFDEIHTELENSITDVIESKKSQDEFIKQTKSLYSPQMHNFNLSKLKSQKKENLEKMEKTNQEIKRLTELYQNLILSHAQIESEI
ncbi:MAG: hypothetical protein EBQ92_03455, partial [Proteobacteria bacterium]|nr:hypothetical protein [Pseudomonadota bacterium]